MKQLEILLVLVMVVAVENVSSTTVSLEDCGSNPADIVFLLDSSLSVGSSNFQKQKDFVARFAQAFTIGPNNVQFGTTTFASTPYNEFNLNTYHDKTTLVSNIYKIPYRSGGTRTDLALKYIEANSFTNAAGDRDHVANILIVMTDGRSSQPTLTTAEAKKLHQMNVNVFAIGIGAGVDMTELGRIASDANHVFQVQNFDALNTLQEELKKTACKRVAVDGGWSAYGSYSTCTKTCGFGTQYRTRTCWNPAPVGSVNPCVGLDRETRYCNTQACPVPTTQVTTIARVDGGWSQFGSYSSCSNTCGGGIQMRTRSCSNPTPAGGGRQCDGQTVQIQPCNTQPCSIDGGWGEFGNYSTCTKTCAGGFQFRNRSCTNPAPQFGGRQCVGDVTQLRMCNVQRCPVDGGWSQFDNYSTCSNPCGSGIQFRERTCSNPAPTDGGRPCSGLASETRMCNQQPCEIDGGWSAFGGVSACTASCGNGTQFRARTCSNPAPQHGGRKCQGPTIDVRYCNTQPCAVPTTISTTSAATTTTTSHTTTTTVPAVSRVDGGWTVYGPWSTCSKTCESGTHHRDRTCTGPKPAHGGKRCVGSARETAKCNTQACPTPKQTTPTPTTPKQTTSKPTTPKSTSKPTTPKPTTPTTPWPTTPTTPRPTIQKPVNYKPTTPMPAAPTTPRPTTPKPVNHKPTTPMPATPTTPRPTTPKPVNRKQTTPMPATPKPITSTPTSKSTVPGTTWKLPRITITRMFTTSQLSRNHSSEATSQSSSQHGRGGSIHPYSRWFPDPPKQIKKNEKTHIVICLIIGSVLIVLLLWLKIVNLGEGNMNSKVKTFNLQKKDALGKRRGVTNVHVVKSLDF